MATQIKSLEGSFFVAAVREIIFWTLEIEKVTEKCNHLQRQGTPSLHWREKSIVQVGRQPTIWTHGGPCR